MLALFNENRKLTPSPKYLITLPRRKKIAFSDWKPQHIEISDNQVEGKDFAIKSKRTWVESSQSDYVTSDIIEKISVNSSSGWKKEKKKFKSEFISSFWGSCETVECKKIKKRLKKGYPHRTFSTSLHKKQQWFSTVENTLFESMSTFPNSIIFTSIWTSKKLIAFKNVFFSNMFKESYKKQFYRTFLINYFLVAVVTVVSV